jgi:hypothetical protein
MDNKCVREGNMLVGMQVIVTVLAMEREATK